MGEDEIQNAIEKIKKAKLTVAFSGAGISVASGIPPFRGKDGLWSKYDPTMFDIDFFMNNPKKSWELIKGIFYSLILKSKPNPAHYALAKLGCPIITQNIDGLHQDAGSKEVVEFHGTSKTLTCVRCGEKIGIENIDFNSSDVPKCSNCGGLLKPDFVFFKEPIPDNAFKKSVELASDCDLMILIGTTGEVMPASQIPYLAKKNGAYIIEINIEKSRFTNDITDIFLEGKAEEILPKLAQGVEKQ